MPIARTMALVDRADHPRKAHIGAVPLVGGIALFPAIAIACIQAVALGASDDALGMMVGVVFSFFMIGYADDRMQIRPSRRLLLTLVLFAALVLMTPAFMPSVFTIGGLELHIGPGTIALLAIIGASGALNAINMADGQDGLCVGLLLIWLMFLAAKSTLPVQSAALLAALALGVVLVFNLAGLVFLGDIGAYGVGAFVLSLMLYGAGDGSIDHGQIVALLAVPVTDCILLMIERVRGGHSPYDPDRQHLHHILQATFGKWPSLAVYLSFVALCAFGAYMSGPATIVAIGGAIAFVVIARRFGRRETEDGPPLAGDDLLT
ncbi:MAG: MraY family glycosyltransferase [Micropepsaceae bacterium]